MKKLSTLFPILVLLSCINKPINNKAKISKWESLKDSFAVRNLTKFVIDSQLEKSFKGFHLFPVHSRFIDSIICCGSPYLYSWQERDEALIEFTIFVHDEDHGSGIEYFIFDKNDSLRSVTNVASLAGEGGIRFETQSHFISKDTLIKITAATTWWDLDKPAPPPILNKPIGDSTFYFLKILKDGKVVKTQFAEKKELNLNFK